jgi:hypothetical protein
MPIILNTSNISVQYNTGSNYIIETVKSDIYVRGTTSGNLSSEPTVSPTLTSNIGVFTHSGGTENQTPHTIYFPENTVCDILIVGGGGSGSANHGGGGGAGAVVFIKSVVLNSGTYTINVGKGGSSTNFTADDISAIGNKGIDSKILFNSSEILKAEGGGAGGASHTTGNGGSGGSGGGADGYTLTTITNNSGAGTVGTSSIFTYNGTTGIKYGNVGGNRNTEVADNAGSGGSGGGAGSPGSRSSSPYIGASGGNGVCNAIINSVTYDFSSIFGNSYGVNNDGNNNRYFGGGGGSSYWNRSGFTPSRTSALGGKGGGGDGGFNNDTSSVIAKDGLSNSGGGGGGGNGDGAFNIRNGGAGGSGIVIIKVISPTTNKYLFFNYLPTQPTLNYTLTFPTITIANFNNSGDKVLNGQYTVSVRTTQSTISPTQGQNLQDRLYFTSNLAIRYHTLNPIKQGAQWTYSSTNPNVYHLGYVGIGTTSPEYSLDVRGFIYSSSGGYTSSALTTWTVLSDSRIKENIVKASYDKCLENVKNIELYNFNFKDNYVNTNDRHQLGFIAQEVQQIYPKAVEVSRMIMNLEEKIDDLLTLNTTQIDYTLYGSVKCLIQKLENIKIKMEQIKTIYNITT